MGSLYVGNFNYGRFARLARGVLQWAAQEEPNNPLERALHGVPGLAIIPDLGSTLAVATAVNTRLWNLSMDPQSARTRTGCYEALKGP